MLVGADIAQRRDLAFVPDEANRVATRAHALEDRTVCQVGHGRDRLEVGASGRRIENGTGSAGHSSRLVNEVGRVLSTLLWRKSWQSNGIETWQLPDYPDRIASD